MKAYKGFNRDMTCRGLQFEEGKTYEHEGDVQLCESGFHACEDPMDCLRYYAPCESVYHEVDLDGVSDERQEDTKVVGKKIRIGARMSVKDIVNASIDYVFASCKDAKDGDYASGNGSRQAASGNESRQAASGHESSQAASGYESRQAASGDWSRQAASGHESRQAASGNWSRQAASGCRSRQETTGKNCVMMSAGDGGKAKGKLGSWIVLTEWKNGVPNVVARRIDGVEVKEDVWYKLENGVLVEAQE